jgi:hypothetical protein
VCDSERERNATTSASSAAQILLTSDLEMPASTPRALTRSSTFASGGAVHVGLPSRPPAAPGRCGGGLQQRREAQAFRSFGMRNSTSPTLVDNNQLNGVSPDLARRKSSR